MGELSPGRKMDLLWQFFLFFFFFCFTPSLTVLTLSHFSLLLSSLFLGFIRSTGFCIFFPSVLFFCLLASFPSFSFCFVFLFLILLPYSWATLLTSVAPLMQGSLKHSSLRVCECFRVFYTCSVKTSLLQIGLFIFATVS